MDQLLSEPCRSVEVSCGTRTDWHLSRSSIDVTLSSNAQEGTFGADTKDDIPLVMPEAHGNSVQINTFVDADDARNKITRRSYTGILIFLKRAPIVWYSKCQNTVETSTFGSEFAALRIATELIKSLSSQEYCNTRINIEEETYFNLLSHGT
eukprot:15044151-Ditylum_brightwellii.AAC.1